MNQKAKCVLVLYGSLNIFLRANPGVVPKLYHLWLTKKKKLIWNAAEIEQRLKYFCNKCPHYPNYLMLSI